MKKCNNIFDELDAFTDTIKEGTKTARNGKKLLDYWAPSNSEQRKRDAQQVRAWRIRNTH